MASLGTQLFTGSWDTTIKVWDLVEGQAVTAHKLVTSLHAKELMLDQKEFVGFFLIKERADFSTRHYL